MDTSGIDKILAHLREAAAAASGHKPEAGAKADFGQVLKASLDQVNQAQQNADQLARRFSLGDPAVELHEVMIALQKANISFQAAVQVRNKLVAAYQDIMNMQI